MKNENPHYDEFLLLRKQIGILDKQLAYELGVTPRAITERTTGRAVIKRETIMAMQLIMQERQYALPGVK